MSQQLDLFTPIEEQIKSPIGNGRLVAYGIQNEESDFRVHVGYQTQHVLTFPTSSGKKYVKAQLEKDIELKTASQNGIVTAQGYAAPISHIDGLQETLIPPDIYNKYKIHQGMTTSHKGALAVSIVVDMLKRNLIPLPVQIRIIDEESLQISGTDIIIHNTLRLQVKCDYKAGPRHLGGTGNIYLQIAECNPYQRY